jgi:hypothetical protein
MSEYQEEVLTNLLDLQAELRGDEPEAHVEVASASPEEPSPAPSADTISDGGQDDLAVSEQDLTVTASPGTGQGVNERLAALHERLARLEYDLAGVTKRIERIEPDLEMDAPGHPDIDVDARWRSFLDLQKIVADRLDQR